MTMPNEQPIFTSTDFTRGFGQILQAKEPDPSKFWTLKYRNVDDKVLTKHFHKDKSLNLYIENYYINPMLLESKLVDNSTIVVYIMAR